ncbi:MAG: leucine-rich repeat domain-containing protein [Alphaproteobacteria bacterium]|nr:leucine-rich repeat domain-containing protein [Alphaproteobacteria bacterium]
MKSFIILSLSLFLGSFSAYAVDMPSQSMMILGQQKTTALRKNIELKDKNASLLAEKEKLEKKKKGFLFGTIFSNAAAVTTIAGGVIAKKKNKQNIASIDTKAGDVTEALKKKAEEEKTDDDTDVVVIGDKVKVCRANRGIKDISGMCTKELEVGKSYTCNETDVCVASSGSVATCFVGDRSFSNGTAFTPAKTDTTDCQTVVQGYVDANNKAASKVKVCYLFPTLLEYGEKEFDISELEKGETLCQRSDFDFPSTLPTDPKSEKCFIGNASVALSGGKIDYTKKGSGSCSDYIDQLKEDIEPLNTTLTEKCVSGATEINLNGKIKDQSIMSDVLKYIQTNCPNITYLDLGDNSLTVIPAISLSKLKELDLYNNKLTALPVLTTPALLNLDIYQNKFTIIDTLPKTITKLDISNNKIIGISVDLGNVKEFHVNSSEKYYPKVVTEKINAWNKIAGNVLKDENDPPKEIPDTTLLVPFD